MRVSGRLGSRRVLMALATALVALALAGCRGTCSGTPAHTGSVGASPPPPPSPSAATATAAPNPHVCGAWSSATSPLGGAITAQYGEIRNCLLDGRTWVITTLGEHGTQPIVALYPCKASDTSCLDGQQPHPLSGWRFVKPPYPGGVTVLAALSDQQLVVDVGGHQINFNVTTHQFSNASPTALDRPEGLAIASNGDLLITNQGTNQILRRQPDGTLAVVAGTGVAGYTGDGGPARDAELNAPSGVAVAADGTIYVADTGNNRVRAISPSGTITTVAGNGQHGDAGVGGPAVDAAISAPDAVAVAPGGRLYVVDNTGVQLIGPTGILKAVVASGPGVLAVHGVQTAFSPSAIAIGQSGDLYVADSSPKLLLHLSPTGQVVNSWPIYVSRAGLATAPDDSILVADYGFAIDRIADDRLTAVVRFPLHSPPGLTGGFRPSGIAVAGSGQIYADDSGVNAGSDQPEIVAISPAGQVQLLPTP